MAEESDMRSEGEEGALLGRALRATVSPLVCILYEMGSQLGV